MDIWLWAVFGLLFMIILGLSAKILAMRKAAREIEEKLAEKLITDTNTLIDISSRDRHMRRLAAGINVQLRSLRKERQRFQQGDRELKNAVTNISHDLRTPLTAISGYLDLLETVEKGPEASRYTKIIRSRTEALTQLTEELFRYSVITSPEYTGKRELLSVNQVLEESLLGFYALFQERGITPEIQITETKVLRMLDGKALSRVFSNLINNAVKYSPGDLKITLKEDGSITFSNQAPDLSPLQVERLFDRFYTVEDARKSTGLGLSISRTLIQQMGGFISAGYEQGKLWIFIQLPPKEQE